MFVLWAFSIARTHTHTRERTHAHTQSQTHTLAQLTDIEGLSDDALFHIANFPLIETLELSNSYGCVCECVSAYVRMYMLRVCFCALLRDIHG